MGQSQKKEATPELFDELVHTTAFSSIEIKKLYEEFIKDFPKGYADRDGFKNAYTKMFPQRLGANKFAGHIFRMYDVDGNGRMEFREYVSGLSVSMDGTVEEKLQSCFRLYDKDRSGYITLKELTDILFAIYESSGHPEAVVEAKQNAERIMNKADSDKNNKLTMDEFVQAATGCSEVLHLIQGML